jgi:hypothetical protein
MDRAELYGVLLVWLGLMTVVCWYGSRIFLMLREQSIIERAYRMHLAVRRGRQVREQAAESRLPQA